MEQDFFNFSKEQKTNKKERKFCDKNCFEFFKNTKNESKKLKNIKKDFFEFSEGTKNESKKAKNFQNKFHLIFQKYKTNQKSDKISKKVYLNFSKIQKKRKYFEINIFNFFKGTKKETKKAKIVQKKIL